MNPSVDVATGAHRAAPARSEREYLPKPEVSRLDSLTGLRWFAAFAVFLHHAQILGSIPALTAILKHGVYGVTFFFVLSGFVLTWSATRSTSAPTFYWRRFSRIYPSHFVALLIAIPVFYSFTPDPSQSWVKPVSVGILLLSVPLIQAWWSDPTIQFSGNPAAWTLTCEFFFYALHPFVMALVRRLFLRGALAVALVVFLLEVGYREGLHQMPHSWLADIPVPVTELPAFIIGMCLAVAMRRGWRVSVHPVFAYLATGVVVLSLARLITHRTSNQVGLHALLMTPELMLLCCVAMIACVASRDLTAASSWLRKRFWVRLGEWSFCFYLVHATFIYILKDIVGVQRPGWSNLEWWGGLLLIGLVGTAALHYIIEKPLERNLRGWWEDRLATRLTNRTIAAA